MAWSQSSKKTRVYALGSKWKGPSVWQGSKRGGERRELSQGGGVGGPRKGEGEDAKGADKRVRHEGGGSTVDRPSGRARGRRVLGKDVMQGPKRAEFRSKLP